MSIDSSASQPAVNRTLIVALLIAGAFVTILNQTLMLVAIPAISAEFNAEPSLVQWVTTAFMLANGILIPVSAVLIDRYSDRVLYLTALGIFVAGTLIGAFSTSFAMLLVARIVQGAAAGLIIPMIQTLVMSLFPPHRRGAAMGLVGLAIAFAPAIGPTLSGWIVEHLSWRALFILMLPISALVWLATAFFMTNVTPRRDRPIDALSVVLSTFGWGGLLYGFSVAGSHGWGSQEVLIALIGGAVSLTWFVHRQTRLSQPLLDMAVFRSPVFTLTTALCTLIFLLMIGVMTLIPIYVQNALELGALVSGLVLLPGAIINGVMSPVAGRLYDRFGIGHLAPLGFALISLAIFLLMQLGTDASPWSIAAFVTLLMFGVSLLFLPLVTAGINALPHALIAHATAMNNTLRMVGASVGTALLVTVMSWPLARAGANVAHAAAMADGVHLAFGAALLLALLGLVGSLWLWRLVSRPPVDDVQAH
ncbi:DHA2 family efflux MFS transporter permease subunit [Saccharospirillum mangrovi]|uniref:DHA2 family efflux MFS transporter permease subunit n=1 Tax=Saccharospirillum mangrovi TaxID=2161747 RepID=UPI000D3AEFBE|nr:DHA2 family efflux MFS transporter permease subunit [Saccharospirillum mangrovi]